MSDEDDIKLRLHTQRRCYVIVRPDDLPETRGGLFVPEAYLEKAEDRFWWGTVEQVPKGWRDDKGRVFPPDVKPGDRVYYDRNCNDEGDPLGAWGLSIIPEEAIMIRQVADDEEEREGDGDASTELQ